MLIPLLGSTLFTRAALDRLKAQRKDSENFKNSQVHIHGLLGICFSSAGHKSIRYIERRGLISLREMLGTTRVEEDAQRKDATEMGE